MFLLDTNVISELRKILDGRADPGVAARAAGAGTEHSFVSALTLMEIEIGIFRVERRDPG